MSEVAQFAGPSAGSFSVGAAPPVETNVDMSL